MNRAQFFDVVRRSFDEPMTQPQVDGIEALLDAGRELPLHHMANVLAQVRRETAGYMSPIKETVMPWHKNKTPSDAEVIRRLNVAWKARKLKGVKAPYWHDGWFGRGQIQITHKANYDRFGVTKEQALDLPTSARIAVRGMRDGMFTGKKLSDYDFPAALGHAPAMNPRRIVNGQDGSDGEVALFHRQFAAALRSAGWVHVNETPKTEHVRPDVLKPEPRVSVWRFIWAALAAVFVRDKRK